MQLALGLAAVLVVAVVAFAAYVAMKPSDFRVERSGKIAAPPEAIFERINDFHRWLDWSPWEKLDPNLKRTFSGPSAGVGAAYGWEGNPKVGTGRMEILESSAPMKIVIKLDFLKPFEGHNVTQFDLRAEGGATEVVWSMRGPQPFMMKMMSVFADMDKMVGKSFEEGLASLRALCESPRG